MAKNSTKFNYQRQDNFDEPEEEPAIRSFEILGELDDVTKDPNWTKTRLYNMYNEVEPLLNALSERSKSVTALQLDQYKPEVQAERRQAHIREPFEQILKLIRTERERSKKAIENLEKRILSESEPGRPADIADRFSADSLNAEIRMLIRSQDDTQNRISMITEALNQGDDSFLKAAISAPDQIIPENRLREIRRQYAFTKNASLQDAEADAKAMEKAIERRTSQISGTAAKILMNNALEMPMSKQEFFEYFPAKNELDDARKQRIVNAEAELNRLNGQRENFNAQNIGVAM